jgi:hypothetical protein
MIKKSYRFVFGALLIVAMSAANAVEGFKVFDLGIKQDKKVDVVMKLLEREAVIHQYVKVQGSKYMTFMEVSHYRPFEQVAKPYYAQVWFNEYQDLYRIAFHYRGNSRDIFSRWQQAIEKEFGKPFANETQGDKQVVKYRVGKEDGEIATIEYEPSSKSTLVVAFDDTFLTAEAVFKMVSDPERKR